MLQVFSVLSCPVSSVPSPVLTCSCVQKETELIVLSCLSAELQGLGGEKSPKKETKNFFCKWSSLCSI